MTGATRVLKRDDLTVRVRLEDELGKLRHDIDAEIAAGVATRVAAAEAAMRSSQDAEHTAALQAATRAIETAAAAFPERLSQAVGNLADEVVEVAAALVEWLCTSDRPAAQAWTDGLSRRIVDALGQLTEHETATIRVSPMDARTLAEATEPAIAGAELRADTSMTPGCAVITTPSGDVDLTLRTALHRAVETVTGRAAAALTDHRDLG